jgi:hypothetical protein
MGLPENMSGVQLIKLGPEKYIFSHSPNQREAAVYEYWNKRSILLSTEFSRSQIYFKVAAALSSCIGL